VVERHFLEAEIGGRDRGSVEDLRPHGRRSAQTRAGFRPKVRQENYVLQIGQSADDLIHLLTAIEFLAAVAIAVDADQ
jgi:hypothetical protein